MKTCALCNEERELVKSHVVPRFVAKWLKDTSATGFLRNPTNPKKRLQDFGKETLLCKACEQKLSALETYFANEFFYPFLKERKNTFQYDSRLMRFAISLNWRLLIANREDYASDSLSLKPYVDRAKEDWRRILFLDPFEEIGKYEHHLFFLDFINNEVNVPDGFYWYLLRGADSTLVWNKKKIFSYTKLPWIIIVSSIFPERMDGWEGTRIGLEGRITQKQSIKDPLFGDFLIERAQTAYGAISKIFALTEDRLLKRAIEKRPDKVLRSQTLEVSLRESKRRRSVKRILPSVRTLIEVIENGEDVNQTEDQKRAHRIKANILADVLSEIPDEEARRLELLLGQTLKRAKTLDQDTECHFDTNEIVLTFMVNLYSTIDERRSRTEDELSKLIEKRGVNEKKHLMVISWNPYETDSQFLILSSFN